MHAHHYTALNYKATYPLLHGSAGPLIALDGQRSISMQFHLSQSLRGFRHVLDPDLNKSLTFLMDFIHMLPLNTLGFNSLSHLGAKVV